MHSHIIIYFKGLILHVLFESLSLPFNDTFYQFLWLSFFCNIFLKVAMFLFCMEHNNLFNKTLIIGYFKIIHGVYISSIISIGRPLCLEF